MVKGRHLICAGEVFNSFVEKFVEKGDSMRAARDKHSA
jgi:hypothetical protein